MAKKKPRKSPAKPSKTGRKLLFITYFFPPTAGGGVFRPLAMVKYLSRLGWDITVLTAKTPKHYPRDFDLVKQIPENVEVIRRKVVWEGKFIRRALGKAKLDWIPKHLITPDERIFWAEKTETYAKKLLRKKHYDCLYTTGPPFSINLCGLWLKRVIDIPWLAEFRDPWTLAPYLSIPNAHQRRFAEETESDLMKSADAVVMVTPTFAKLMRDKYSENARKVLCVPNGYDADVFRNLPPKKVERNEKFTIVASGTVFGRNNMNDFLKALEEMRKSKPDIYDKFTVMFQGLPDHRLNQRLLESGLTDRCESRGFVGHAENIKDLCTTDLLILPLARVPNCEGHIPSRTYEYLASGTPILAICPDGDLADLLSGYPQVIRVKPRDTESVLKELKNAVSRWEDRIEPTKVDPSVLRQLTRKLHASEMDRVLREITTRGVEEQ